MTAEIPTSINRLAGTTQMGVDRAASIYAGVTNETLVGALNIRAGNALPNYLDLDGVANQLAGTTGFSAQAALDMLAFGPVDTGNTWASLQGTWAQQNETWSNL